MSKLECYKGLLSEWQATYLMEAAAANYEFDCPSYGDKIKNICAIASQARNDAATKRQTLTKLIKECSEKSQ